MHDHKSPTQDSCILKCTIMQTNNDHAHQKSPTREPCSHWSTLTPSEISHPRAVLPLEHHPHSSHPVTATPMSECHAGRGMVPGRPRRGPDAMRVVAWSLIDPARVIRPLVRRAPT